MKKSKRRIAILAEGNWSRAPLGQTLKQRLVTVTALVVLMMSSMLSLPTSAAPSGQPDRVCGRVGLLVGFVVLDAKHIAGSTDAGAMVRSNDSGHCWERAGLAQPALHRLSEFLPDPSKPGVILAGAGPTGRIGFGYTTGLLRSADGGRSWQQIQQGLPITVFTVNALVAARGQLFLALTCPEELRAIQSGNRPSAGLYRCGQPIYRSTDHGLSWQPTALGNGEWSRKPFGPRFDGGALALTGNSHNTLYAAMAPLDGTAGLYSTSDNGQHWRMMGSEDRLKDTTALLALKESPPVLLAGVGILMLSAQVVRSGNNGRSWQQATLLHEQETEIEVLNFVAATSGVFFAGLDHVYRSRDAGRTWSQTLGAGLPSGHTGLLTRATDGALVISRLGGLYRSHDGGDHWQPV